MKKNNIIRLCGVIIFDKVFVGIPMPFYGRLEKYWDILVWNFYIFLYISLLDGIISLSTFLFIN